MNVADEAREDIKRRCQGAPDDVVDDLLERAKAVQSFSGCRLAEAVNSVMDAKEMRRMGWPVFLRSVRGGKRCWTKPKNSG